MSNRAVWAFIICMDVSTVLMCMDEPTKIDQSELYDLITQKHEKKLNNYLTIQAPLSPFGPQVKALHAKLGRYEQKVIEREHLVLKNIIDTYCKNQQSSSLYENLVNTFRRINEEYKNIVLENVTHSPSIPFDCRSMLYEEAHKKNINLKRISIEDCNEQGVSFFESRAPMPANRIETKDEKRDIIILEKHFIPGELLIDMKYFSEQTLKTKQALCVYFLEPMIQEFTIRYRALQFLEELYCSEKGTIVKSEEYKTLHRLHIQFCTLLPALRSKREASIMKFFHRTSDTDELLPIEDYNLLCRIDRTWRTIAWLEKYGRYNGYSVSNIRPLLSYDTDEEGDKKEEGSILHDTAIIL